MAKRTDNPLKNVEKLIEAATTIRQSKIPCEIQRKLLNELIWKIGEAKNSKYDLRYRSKEAKGVKDVKKLHHEHVYPRKGIIDQLLKIKDEAKIKKILRGVRTCVVLRTEHETLKEHDGLEGWLRYKKAGIKVYDVRSDSDKPVPYEKLIKDSNEP